MEAWARLVMNGLIYIKQKKWPPLALVGPHRPGMRNGAVVGSFG